MLTKELPKTRVTPGSYSVLQDSSASRLRLRIAKTALGWRPASAPPPTKKLAVSRPVQTQGDSRPSRNLNTYLHKVLVAIRDSASQLPSQIRITSPSETGTYDMDPWDAKNGRRIRLIEKKYAQGLSDQESVELGRLKREVYDHLREIAPRPMDSVTEAEARIERLRRRIAAKKGKKA